jgi:hypothetical protein
MLSTLDPRSIGQEPAAMDLGYRRLGGLRQKGKRRWPDNPFEAAQRGLLQLGNRPFVLPADKATAYPCDQPGADKCRGMTYRSRGGAQPAATATGDGRCGSAIFAYCEPTAHRLVRRVFLPPPHHPPECLWEPPAAAWSGVG